jgi:chemotaxis protein methyltransferase CheR
MGGTERAGVAPSAIELAAQRIESETGLHFSGGKRRQFDAALRRMAQALGEPDAERAARWLLAGSWDGARSEMCARFLTVGETYFFREPRALDLLCQQARAHLARRERRPLKVWSAGCCTGEEPYSIAIALRERVPGLDPCMVSILATDLNETFLGFARAGVYRRWSFRRTDPARVASHFRPLPGGRFEIAASLREQVDFEVLNLAGDSYPSAANGTQGVDVIFCRNVLMYFARPQMKRVIARLRDCLAEGGWLVVNPSEAAAELFEGFTPEYHPDAVFFRKTSLAQRAAAPACRAESPATAAQGPRTQAGGARAPRPALAPAVRQRAAPAGSETLHRAAPAQAAGAAEQGGALARAGTLSAAGEREEALKCLRRAAEAAPLDALLHRDAALFALEHGDQRLARDSVKRLLYLEPGSAFGHYLAALVEDARGRRAQAVRLLYACRALITGAGPDAELRETVDLWLERVQ